MWAPNAIARRARRRRSESIGLARPRVRCRVVVRGALVSSLEAPRQPPAAGQPPAARQPPVVPNSPPDESVARARALARADVALGRLPV
jgi:hypothetical protein